MNDPGDENDFRFRLCDLQVGQAIDVKTLNSTYRLRKQTTTGIYRVDQVTMMAFGYALSPNPVIAEVINTNLIAGECLRFMRPSPVDAMALRVTVTSPIESWKALQ